MATHQDMDEAIRLAIRDIYKAEYNKQLRVEKLEHGWKVILGMNHPEHPIIIMADLPDCKFLKFFKQELHNRHLDYIQFDEGYKEDPYRCPIDPKCIDCQ